MKMKDLDGLWGRELKEHGGGLTTNQMRFLADIKNMKNPNIYAKMY